MNLLSDARPENYFYCADGSILRNLFDLQRNLESMSSRTYLHHVNESRNDFCNWIRDIYQDQKLTAQLQGAKSAKQAADAVKKSMLQALLDRKEIERAIAKAKTVKKLRSRKATKKKRLNKPKRRQKMKGRAKKWLKWLIQEL